MAEDDQPLNTVDRVFALLDDMERILNEVRELAQQMKEQDR